MSKGTCYMLLWYIAAMLFPPLWFFIIPYVFNVMKQIEEDEEEDD